jgi:hypothetical protein
MGDAAALAHHENVHRPVNADSVGKGRKLLDEQQRGRLEQLIGEQLKKQGYAPAV